MLNSRLILIKKYFRVLLNITLATMTCEMSYKIKTIIKPRRFSRFYYLNL